MVQTTIIIVCIFFSSIFPCGFPYIDNTLKNAERICPTLPAPTGLDVNRLVGQWWKLLTFNQYIRPGSHSCTVSKFYKKPNNSKIQPNTGYKGVSEEAVSFDVLEDFFNFKDGHNKLKWSLVQNGPKPVGRMFATQFIENDGIVTFNYDIISTDYNNYLMAYTCRNGTDKRPRIEGGVVLTRRKKFYEGEIREVERKLKSKLQELSIESYLYSIKNNTLCEDVTFPSDDLYFQTN